MRYQSSQILLFNKETQKLKLDPMELYSTKVKEMRQT